MDKVIEIHYNGTVWKVEIDGHEISKIDKGRLLLSISRDLDIKVWSAKSPGLCKEHTTALLESSGATRAEKKAILEAMYG